MCDVISVVVDVMCAVLLVFDDYTSKIKYAIFHSDTLGYLIIISNLIKRGWDIF